ncbi:MAG: 23S rRNA (guanosine(2251)-2'-O)-methyltransferase RlmB [Actinomycetaceae bacterium]|nr:23S rRNA (guanosine(2251)-2'-O)-methyltransferase RlmB [Actinomycetaceae bacterium]
MPGNQQSHRPKKKKGPTVGSGGKRRRGLEGRGPTPKAEDRVYHVAHKRKLKAEAEARQAAERKARTPGVRAAIQLAAGHELIAGRNPVVEAVRSGIPLTRVFMVGSLVGDERLGEVVRTATALGTPLVEVSRAQLERMTDGAVHQGIAIEVPPYEYADLTDVVERAGQSARAGRAGLIVALDSVTDPHNLGAVLRSASAFGADGVVIPERRSAGVGVAAWKVSAGAASRVPVARVPNLVGALERLKKEGYFVVGLDGGADTAIDTLGFADAPLVLVTGSEGKGLARLTRETCDAIASIPIAAELESLNAAVATGIALYQIDRMRAGQAQAT